MTQAKALASKGAFSSIRYRKNRDRVIELLLLTAGLVAVFTTAAIVFILVYESVAFFDHVSIKDFLTDTMWTPLFADARYGIMPLVAGTLTVTGVALLVAIPLGTIIAIYLSEFAPHRLRETVKPVLELLGAVPTVVYGYFALLMVTPLLQKIYPELPGFNMLSAGLVIGLMIIPYVATVAEDAMRAVPRYMREGSYAMGATKLQTALRVVVPGAFSGLAAAYILGISRAVGETMVVAIAAGMQPNLTFNPAEPAATITAFIVQVSLGDLPHGSIGYQKHLCGGPGADAVHAGFQRDRLLPDTPLPGGVLMAATAQMTLEEIRRGLSWRKQLDKVFILVGLAILFACLAILAVLFLDLVRDGASRFGWSFFTSFPSRKAVNAGILSAAVGTALMMFVTALVALPIGVAAAIYLEEYAPKNWFTGIIEINVTNLAGVPSIIYGLLALGLFVYQFGFGQSILTGGLTLALLILPIIIVATRESLRSVPKAIREAAYGLGATRWEVTKDHVLPYSTGGILTGLILGLSRAIGETAPIITIGALAFIAYLPPSPVECGVPVTSISSG